MNLQELFMIIIIGTAAGMLSGLVGVGGGIIMVPAMVYFLKYSQHQAQGTSLGVLTFPVVLVAFLTYYTECKKRNTPIDMKIIAILGIGFIIGSFLGSKMALKINEALMKKIFSIILFYTAFKMLEWDTAIIQWFKK